MPLLLAPISMCAPPSAPPLTAAAHGGRRARAPAPPRHAPAPLSIPSPPPLNTNALDWLGHFAFLNFPADSYQIPHPPPPPSSPPLDDDAAVEAELAVLLEREKERERAWRADHRWLRQRQVKAETEAWARAAEEYRQLEREMLDCHLAPALPYVKSLFLG